MNTTGDTDTAPRSRSRRSTKPTTTSTNNNNYNNRLNGHKMAVQPVLGSTVISKNIQNPCNPLGYLQARQIDDKLNYCHKLVNARLSNAQNLFRKDLYSHYGCVNAIEFFKEGDLLISGGDDKRVLLWNVEKAIQEQAKPTVMKAQHMSNIFCLGYNNSKTKIFSAGNDDQVIVHDLHTTEVLNFFRHEKPVYGLSVHPYNDNVFSSACDDGRVLIYDIRGSASSPESFFCVAQHKNPFHSVMFNPVDPVMLATANTKEGVSMWDVRKPLKPVLRYGAEGAAQSCMNVRFNQAGTTLLALRRRLPPVLYDVNSPTHICQFDQTGYYNSCTMKSCCFAGTDDKYILSGSDDFNLYMWEIPTDDSVKVVTSAHMILRGHRSIVNQVRYNEASCVLASSGVEKIIKLWSPFPLSRNCSGGLKMEDDKEEKQRRVYSHDEYIALVLRSGQFMTHDYSHQSTDEDQRMMAFFDSLVQREIESWSSEDVPTPQSPSEPENNNVSDHNDSSDSEDSTDSDRHLVRCYLRSTLNSPSSPNVPERPLESPNRITRLIANRREKLMRLAALETASQSKNGTPSSRKATTTTKNISPPMDHTAESASASELENNNRVPESTRPNKITLRSKGIKRKHSCRRTTRTSRIRRKQSNPKEDSDTDLEEPTSQSQSNRNNYHSGDGAQPSTSSGVIASRRSRYATTSLTSKTRHQQIRSTSSSSNEDNIMNSISDNNDKRQCTKSDSDSSTTKEAVPQKRKSTRIKCKATSSVPVVSNQARCTKNKRQNNDTNRNNHNNKSNAVLTQNNETRKEPAVTPSRSTRNTLTSDSGINSGISTNEKMNNPTSSEKSNSTRGRGGSSDRERIIKNFEWFQKKVDQARRGYRKRAMLPHPSSSDSSDE